MSQKSFLFNEKRILALLIASIAILSTIYCWNIVTLSEEISEEVALTGNSIASSALSVIGVGSISKKSGKKDLVVSGHQPNYLPWLGFFDKMQKADLFLIADSVQYERRGYTNRNQIKQHSTARWLTVPLEDGGEKKPIREIKIANGSDWARKHWLSIKYNYSKSAFWDEYSDFFEDAYSKNWEYLMDLNLHLINGIRGFLGIKTPLVFSSSLKADGQKGDLVLAMCKELGASVFIAGSGSRAYMDMDTFEKQNVKVVFQDFKYPLYKQVNGDFIGNLSVIDFLFCSGAKSFQA